MRKKIANEQAGFGEVEQLLLNKYAGMNRVNKKMLKKQREKQLLDKVGADEYKKMKYKARFIKKRALIDQNNIVNKDALFSYAQRKWLWYGEDTGTIFDEPDLNDWYNVWNQT